MQIHFSVNFSTEKVHNNIFNEMLLSFADRTGTVKCKQCKNGYMGRLCQDCDPLTHYPDGQDCAPCECNGNGTPIEGKMCDDITG